MALYDITQLSTALEFDTSSAEGKGIAHLPGTNRVVIAWADNGNQGAIRCYTVANDTGEITALGSEVSLGTTTAALPISIVPIDSSNFALFWTGAGTDGFCRLFSVDGSGNISANGGSYEYQTSYAEQGSAILWDSTHILNTWGNDSGNRDARMFVFNTGTGSISDAGGTFTYASISGSPFVQVIRLPNTNKALATYIGSSSDLYARVLDVNTSTWAITGASSAYKVSNTTGGRSAAAVFMEDLGSTMKVVLAISVINPNPSTLYSVSIDTSTWALSTQNDLALVAGTNAEYIYVSLAKASNDCVLVFYNINSGPSWGRAETISYTTGTGLGSMIDRVTIDSNQSFYGTIPPAQISENRWVHAWSGGGMDGFVRAFEVELPSTFNPAIARRRILTM